MVSDSVTKVKWHIGIHPQCADCARKKCIISKNCKYYNSLQKAVQTKTVRKTFKPQRAKTLTITPDLSHLSSQINIQTFRQNFDSDARQTAQEKHGKGIGAKVQTYSVCPL